jgi:hypothetical protein
MGIYTNYTGGYGTNFVGNYTQVEPFVGESFNYHQLGIIAASEISANHNAFMKSIALSELAAIEQTGDTDVLYESVNIKGIFEKIKMFFKKVIEKIHKIFHTFMAKLQSWFGDTKDFATKYEKEVIKNWSQVSNNWDFKGYNFKNVSLTKSNADAIKVECTTGNKNLKEFVENGQLVATLNKMGVVSTTTVTIVNTGGASSISDVENHDNKINLANIPTDLSTNKKYKKVSKAGSDWAVNDKFAIVSDPAGVVPMSGSDVDSSSFDENYIHSIREKLEDIKDNMRKSVIEGLKNHTFTQIIPVNFENPSGIDAKEFTEELFKVFRNDEDSKDTLEKKDIENCYGSISGMMNFLKDYKKITNDISTSERKITKGYDDLIKKMDKEENDLIKQNKDLLKANSGDPKVKTNELVVQLSSLYQSIYSGVSECVTEAFAAWMTATKDACTQAKEIAVKVINLSKKMTESYDYGYSDDRSYDDGGYDFISSVKLV